MFLQAFRAVSGKNGSLIWKFDSQEAKNEIMNLYTAQLIRDIDQDGTVDVLAIHGGDPLGAPGKSRGEVWCARSSWRVTWARLHDVVIVTDESLSKTGIYIVCGDETCL